MTSPFTPKLFTFLRALKRNNDRDWFKANRDRYLEQVRDPALAFIEQVALPLGRISGRFLADPSPVGGSLFRIHRDTRFSSDKSPYKTSVGIQFRHEQGKDVHAPGFYLHLAPGEVFVGLGIWHPDGPTLGALRDAMVENPAAWTKASRGKAFTNRFRLAGDSLKRAPRGYDPEHPLIEDLKRKDLIAVADLDETTVFAPDLVTQFTRLCRTGAPFVRHLTESLGLPW